MAIRSKNAVCFTDTVGHIYLNGVTDMVLVGRWFSLVKQLQGRRAS